MQIELTEEELSTTISALEDAAFEAKWVKDRQEFYEIVRKLRSARTARAESERREG